MALTRLVALGTALIAVLSVLSCSSSRTVPSTQQTSTASQTSSTASEATADPSQDAEAQALALIPRYLQTIDDLYLDPSRSLDELYEVSVAPEATAEATAIGQFRAQGYRQTGRSQLVTASVSEIDLTNEPAAVPSPVFPSVAVTACVDVSQVQATDGTGSSVIAPDRPKYLVQQLTVVNIDYPDASSWRISRAPNALASTCDG
ncbi:hypothetical protein O2W15_11765 [Modestobacter sp. VKM Ac-2979]|uniref:hypothetical protein n=1 Tax=unclassified Modestobacter TaxID=2643866 RepID=UPI0022AB8811|nr:MULTISPECIES: hypothetical protein [unclassified Modestobacter]MCZ2812112.1 hypothetical protein [Modestobacter sp. VKM Ac-2979]MCZ2843836.1 hypothetical protein [Modestobacter sp. VKM Ac-2980]